jgi:hypothetical protein
MAQEARLKLPKKAYKGPYPTTKDEWVKFIKKCHDESLESRKKHELQWAVNLAYYKGFQGLMYDRATGFLQTLRNDTPDIIINRIAAFIDGRHAKITKNRPAARVLPNTNDRADLRAAKWSDQALMHLWRKIDMESQYDRGLKQMLITGNNFMETMWDGNGGDAIENEVYEAGGILSIDDDGEIEKEKIFLGEISSKPVSSFGILPCDESILDVKDQPYISKRQWLPIPYLETIYPHLRGEISNSGDSDKTEYEKMVERLGFPQTTSYGRQPNDRKEKMNGQALVITYMMKPNYQYEQGVAAVTINGKQLAMIDQMPNDFGDNVYPWVHFYENEDGFSFWRQSTIERLIPVQRAINTIKQKKVRNATLMANGKWLLAKGSQVSEEALTDEEGEVIEWNPSVPAPQQAVIAPLPNYMTQLDDELKTDLRDVGGQRETTFNPSPNLTAGVAMQVQAELTDEILGPVIKRIGRAMEKVANQQLLLMDQEYIEPRKIKIFGDEGQTGVEDMTNADLRHHTDVHIEIESLFPEFRGAKRQTLMDLWDRRVIQDPEKLLRAYRSGNYDHLLDDMDKLDDSVAVDIAAIKNGKQPQFHPFQNHSKYVQVLMDWINTPEFLRLIPERKQLALAVLQQHLQFVMGSMPAGGEPVEGQNQAAVNTPFGAAKPVGAA